MTDADALHLDAEDFLTVKQYAVRYNVHIQTVYSAIRHGHQLDGRVVRATKGSIRIAVPRENISTLKSA